MQPPRDNESDKQSSLRRRAETLLRGRMANVGTPNAEEFQRLVYEMELHRIELELQNDELRRTQQELSAARNRYADLYDSAPVAYLTLDLRGTIQEINLTGARMLGADRSRLIGRPFVDYVADGHQGDFLTHLRGCARNNEEVSGELRVVDKGGHKTTVDVRGVPIREVHTNATLCRMSLTDITARTQAADRQGLQARLLDMLNCADSPTDVIRRISGEIKRYTGFDAVGIRLRDGDDFPYYETSGFSHEFLQAERYLCTRDDQGEIVRDHQGNPYLECMCGNVICGRIDASRPFFTEGGSFWTNSTTQLLAATTDADRQTRTRNRCHGEGYESVALIPLRAGGVRIGLLQLNDRHVNRFTLDMIEFFEGIAAAIGVALWRKQTEEQLQQQKEFAESLVNTAQAIVLVLDTVGRVVRINPYLENLSGYRLEEVEGKDWFRTFVPLYRQDSARSAFQSRIHDATAQQYVGRIVTKEGREREIEWSESALSDADGNITGLVAIGCDVTQRRQDQKALEESEQRFRTIFDNAVDGILLGDPETQRLSVGNQRICEMLGYTREELERLTVSEIHPREHLPRVLEEFEKQLLGAETLARDIAVVRKDGSVFWADINAFPIKLSGKTYLAGIFRDVTERKTSEQAFAELAIRERRRLGQDLHDDLGQELTGLVYVAGVLQDELLSEDHPQTELVQRLTRGLQNAINSVRMVAKGLVPVEVDAGGLMAALEHLAATTTERSGLVCQFRCDPDVAVEDNNVATELFLLAQEAVNNAVRHARARRLELELWRGKRLITVRVRDDGRGLADTSDQTSGVGLRIMQHRADLIGAVLKIQAADGGGTEVLCAVPRYSANHERVEGLGS